MKIIDALQPALAAISGGLGDIGLAIAKTLREAGAEVALADVMEPADELPYFYEKADVTDADAVAQWYEKVVTHFGRTPNIIVPNAAIATGKPHLEITAAEWKRELDVNLNGAFYFSENGAKRLVNAGQEGRIIFVGSWAAHAPHAKFPAYSVAKAGLRMLNQTLALELAPKGILVNEVAPGYVNAGLSGKAFAEQPERAAQARAAVPARKLLSADDVALQVLYLCSSAGVHAVGSTLLLDGGLSLLRGPHQP